MWLFWIVAGVLAAAAAALVVTRAVGTSRLVAAGVEDPALPVYRRQLAEIDDLAERGLLGADERRAAHAEAGRRLLAAADRSAAPETAGGRGARLAVLGGIGAAVLVALGLYLVLGAPGDPDQPYKARLAAWRADPSKLRPAEMAAVLRLVVADRPKDPQALQYLGRAEMAANDPLAAAAAFRKAAVLSPDDAELQVMLGEALLSAADGQGAPPDAEAAFKRALVLHPNDLPARYFLARMQITNGDRAAGEAAWKAIEAELAPTDQRRLMLEADMAQALGTQALGQSAAGQPAAGSAVAGVDAKAAAAAQAGAGQGGDQAAFIKSMVAQLAGRLKAMPDDPDGWARLVRAYRVLGDQASERDALERARKQFAGRPQDLAKIEAEAAPR